MAKLGINIEQAEKNYWLSLKPEGVHAEKVEVEAQDPKAGPAAGT